MKPQHILAVVALCTFAMLSTWALAGRTDQAPAAAAPTPPAALPMPLAEEGDDLFEFIIDGRRYTARGYPERFLMHGDNLVESLVVSGTVENLQVGTGLWDATLDEPLFIGRIVAITPPG